MTEKDAPSEERRPPIKTVFIVEDDADIGAFLIEALKLETPYQAVLATDGFQALKMVRSLKPNLFVLDYLLSSMDGLELYDHLQAEEEFKTIPVLFISANLPTGELEKRRVYFLRKPFELEDLLQTIQEIFGQ